MGHDFSTDLGKSLEINQSACAWTIRAMSAIKARLRVNINLHEHNGRLHAGQIFLFNHFARFETFIPQYLIYQETGAYCRSVASPEFFAEDKVFSKYLLGLGAVPNDHPGLLPFLATEILKGRKIVVFPEGGMVKDRRVIDQNGEYSVYSRIANKRRKHHAGMAVLASTLDAFKVGIEEIVRSGDTEQLERWTGELGLESIDTLIAVCALPTSIIPSNITFYPIRIEGNLLQKAAGIFADEHQEQAYEELLIEGNLLLKNTDMDIRLGEAVTPREKWGRIRRKLLGQLVRGTASLDQLFDQSTLHDTLVNRLVSGWLRRQVSPIRDACMREMYAQVTVNLSHLASQLIMKLIDRGRTEIDQSSFHRILYLAIKRLHKEPAIMLHRELRNPDAYRRMLDGDCAELERLFASATRAGLLVRENGKYRFLSKLCEEHDFDQIRLENPIAVAANEVAPVAEATRAIETAMAELEVLDDRDWARAHFDDMLIDHAWQRSRFSSKRYAEINRQETATEGGEPYLIVPENNNGLGVVLVHGFLASPAELRHFGRRLAEAGHPVIGVRLNGHGTSPWDLRGRTWQNWQTPVRAGYRIIAAFSDRVCLVGFSSGGALSLTFAAEQPDKLAAVAAVSAPLKFMNRNLIFVPLIQGANKITKWLPSCEGVVPFRPNESEHPHINYRNLAIRGLFELRRMVDEMETRLPDVACPVTLFQGDQDGVVDPKSADLIYAKLGTAKKWLHMIPTRRHGILNENIENVQEKLMNFLCLVLEGKDPA